MKLKVNELRIKLQKLVLSKTGKKVELQEKLQLEMVNRTPILSIERVSAAPNEFKEGVRWRLLDPEQDEIPMPSNEVDTAYPPKK